MRVNKRVPLLVSLLFSLVLCLTMFAGCGALEESASEFADLLIEDSYEPEYRDEFTFRNKKLLNQHYEKHGIDMGFSSAEEYEKAACDVIYNPDALKKKEKEDGDYVFYVEETNEFVVVSTDGYIRTYFLPDSGKAYYDRQ